jgi:diguanylate cyclase (GGDEF)-like protein
VFEMIANAFICTMFMGGEYGFTMLLLIIPPNSYFMAYHMRKNNFGKIYPLLPSIVSMLAAIVMHIAEHRLSAHYFIDNAHYIDETFTNVIFCCNLMIFFAAIVFIMMAFFASISAVEHELEDKNAQLKAAASSDFLTGALNRRSFIRKFRKFAENYGKNGTVFSVVMGDIDDFKKVNDTYGHDVGDSVIITAVQNIRQNLTENDVICRWGGEEFLLLLADKKLSDAAEIMDKIRAIIEDIAIGSDKGVVNFTMTFGVAEYGGETAEEIVKTSDDRLYYGKAHGKNCVISEKICVNSSRT